jgi:hypothetical protein
LLINFIVGAIFVYVLVKILASFAPSTPSAPTVRPLREFRKQVHGIFHKNSDGTSRQRIIRDCSEGEELQLVPEPDNRVDPGAVKILRMNGEQIGYWPAEAGRVAGDLAIGWTYRVTIDEIYSMPEDENKRGVRMRVEVLTMAHGKRPKPKGPAS